MIWIWCGIALCIGGAFGVGLMCCLIIASEEDRQLEKLKTKEADRKS